MTKPGPFGSLESAEDFGREGIVAGPIRDDEGQFTEWRQLGRSSLGETWAARDAMRGREVVVKVRPPLDASRETCRREAALARKLNTPFLQRFLEYRPAELGPDALIYEYVPGASLKTRLADGPLSRDAALTMARDVLTGLAAAHANGIIHRDVSPENIILSDRGAVLIDFDALGDLVQDSHIGRTTVGGEFAGKPLYMSPEQITGAPQSAASDIWAVGAVLFESLTGRSFRQGESIADLVGQYASTPDVRDAPASLQALLTDMLAPDPGRRPDAIDAIDMIEAALRMSTPPTRPSVVSPSPERPMSRPSPSAPEIVRDLSPASPAKAGGGRAIIAVGLVALPLVAVIVFAAVFRGGALLKAFREQEFHTPHVLGMALVALGVVLVILSFFVARFLRARAAREDVALPFRALDLINAPDARDRLTETICLRIDAYRDLAGKPSEDLLTVTMVALANEYASAETADERFKALAMLNDLHTQVARTLRPWWMNYETLIARVLSLTTLVAGVVTAVEGVRRLF